MTEPTAILRLPVLAATTDAEGVRQLLSASETEIFDIQFVRSLSEAGEVLKSDRKSLVLWVDAETIDSPELLAAIEIPIVLYGSDAHARGKQLRQEQSPRRYIWTLAQPADPAQARQLALSLCQQQLLRNSTLHDSLTGLASRALLIDRATASVLRAKRDPDNLFAMLFLDLERFKLINDSLGHDIADQLLVEISKRILTVVRSLDTVARVEADQLARLGGDEFVLLLDPINRPEDAGRVAERLLRAIAEPFRIGELAVIASLRIGIAFGNSATTRAETVLRDAEAALHHAKRDHKQRYRIYNPDMHAAAVKRLSMEVDLRQAIERDQLCLHYQPIHSLATGKIAEFEALVRWDHPERGRIPPLDFIPLAEETGLIVPLGLWVLRAACKQMMRFAPQAAGMDRVGIGVNVSGRQFARPEFIEDIRNVLRDSGLPPGRLCLEITESAIMENGAPMLEALQAISSLGVRLHLDDFGTGYSSMGYLNQMPIDVLKIDRSFVTKISGSTTGRPIVQAIIALARSLHMEVIAEGVDSEPIMSILTGMGCDCVQGYYLSPPLPPDKTLEYWRRFMNSLQLPMSNKVYISEAS